MKILAKSAPLGIQILDKVKKGCDGIEIQLLETFFQDSFTVDDCFKIITETNAIVYTLHIPIVNGKDTNLENFSYPLYEYMFLKACELSSKLANHYKHNITMVIHNGFSLEQYQTMPLTFEYITNLLKRAFDKYNNIEFAFENILPFVISENKLPTTRNGFLYDNVDVANYFNNLFNTNRFGTVLDTCHFMCTHKIFTKMQEIDKNQSYNEFTLEDFIKANKDTIKIYHLTNIKNLGFGPKEHGTPFTDSKEDIDFLNNFFDLHKKYVNTDPYLTLEIREDNFLDGQGYLQTKNTLMKYFKDQI